MHFHTFLYHRRVLVGFGTVTWLFHHTWIYTMGVLMHLGDRESPILCYHYESICRDASGIG